MNKKAQDFSVVAWIIFILFIVGLIITLFIVYPQYNVYSSEMSGKAQLREAEWNKQIAIEEAKALKESAFLKAEAEVIRAEGMAKANEIIGESLKNNEAYLRYLWINALYEDSNSIIYVPTEANLPILEANRLNRMSVLI